MSSYMPYITIVDIKENIFIDLSDDKLKTLITEEFEVPEDEIDKLISDVKQNIKKIIHDGKLERNECVPIFSICCYVIEKYTIKVYSIEGLDSIILNINHITGKVH